MRLIDADALKEEFGDVNMDIYTDEVKEYIDDAPTIATKQVKYFDEDEKVWKIGNIIKQ